MANPGGGVGAKFVSVNLNKSYGQPSHHNHHHYSGSYGQAAAGGRARPGSGGGSGGMVVLSRSRSSQKAAGPKLSVPPPLNLPSLRKEHERFDLSGSGSGTASGAGPGSGPRPTSSGMSWTKPAAVALQEKDVDDGDPQVKLTGHGVDGEKSRMSSAYMPPSARASGIGVATSSAGSARPFPKPVEKAVVLRGEDFPSLQAAVPVPSGAGQKQKDNMNQKQKLVISEESTDQQRDGFFSNSLGGMHPHGQASDHTSGNVTMANVGESRGFGSLHLADQPRKQDYFPGPLPLVRLNPRSDWADDERDTGHGITERSRDLGFTKTESFWERDFDLPRTSVLPHKPVHNQYQRRGLRDDETGRNFSSDVTKGDPYRWEIRTPSREGREWNTWRSSHLPKDGLNAQEAAKDRNSVAARITGFNKDFGKDNKYMLPHVGDPAQDGSVSACQETTYGRRNTGHFLEGQPQWNNIKESFNSRRSEWNTRERYGAEQSNRYRGDGFRNSNMSKSLYASGGKMPPGTDTLLTSVSEKRASSKTERPYFEDPFMSSAGFDERDPFSGSLVGVIKRKKDVVKQTDLHDPVRESFEAELERVQKMQELERQRIIEEQERTLEQARREDEERQRVIREEEERQRRLEEDAREAAWRAEQERLEAIRRTEEQKTAREEEKRRALIEEERRKQAAKQKLLELEERMAKRQAKALKSDSSIATTYLDEKFPTTLKEKDVSTSTYVETWEDSEKMVERITSSASFDSTVLNRPFEVSDRPYPTRDGSSGFLDRGKPFNSWRRDVFDNGNTALSQLQENEISHSTPRRDSFANSRAVSGKEFHGGAGYISSRTYLRGVEEPYADEFGHQKEQRLNFSGDADSLSRSTDLDSDFQDNLAEKYSNVGWAQNHFRGNTHSSYPERPYPHTEADEHYSYGRSRYSMRQPRVLPPPIASTQRNSFRGANERPGASGFPDDDHYSRVERSETTRQIGYYAGHQDGLQQSELDVPKEDITLQDQKLDKDVTPRCDSQSSLSVSSPPNSPPHLSHDELDDSGDLPMVSIIAEGKHILLSGNESLTLNDNSGQHPRLTASSSVSEDEDWTLENNVDLQQQEEYDEDEDGYQEEDEVHEVDDGNLDLNQEFEDLHLKEKGSSHLMDNLVLGFDEGIEVEIPNDDFDRNFSNEERGFGIPDSAIHIVGEERLVDGVKGDEQSHDEVGGFLLVATMVQETENTMQDSVLKPIEYPYTSITPDTTAFSAQQAISASFDRPSSASLTTVSTASSAPCQVDTPVKLQFGLFSGPSLIPSPVPAIQIGSIQMPLHFHPPIGASLAHMHSSQPPIFQFGQHRYTSPISHGVLPIAPQTMPFVPSNVQTPYSLNQNAGGSLAIEPSPDNSTQNVIKDDVPSLAVIKQPGFVSGPTNQLSGNPSLGLSSALVRQTADNSAHTQVNNARVLSSRDGKLKPESVGQAENSRGHHDAVTKNRIPPSKGTIAEGQLQPLQPSSESVSNEKNFGGMKVQGAVSGSKGKRFTYKVRNSGTRSTFPAADISGSDTHGFQKRSRTVHRTEFRVRENVERRHPTGSFSSNSLNLDDKPKYTGRSNAHFARSGYKRGTMSSKPLKQIAHSESSMSGNFISRDVESGNLVAKENGRDVSMRNQNLFQSGDANLNRNISEEDVDTPLQSGVVRVFKQPGIEAPSNEDDFIEVRSKRQMLNDRREQREKEIKAKSRPPRKPRATRQTIVTTVGSTNSKKVSRSLAGESSPEINSDFASSEGRVLAYKEASAPLVSQLLAPIGTPAVKSETQADKKSQSIKHLQTSSVSIVSGAGKDLGPAVMFESKNKVIDNVQSSLSSWDTARINQQVMALTQTQLEEAMKPSRFDSPIAPVGGHSSSVSDPLLPSSSMLTKERSFSSAASPINSLLAGEKIQFGAVTSPPILPPGSRAPGSSRQDIQISHNPSVAEDDCALFFKKDKQTDDSCVHLQDSEAEAEAAASAVAVAAISNDEVVGNGLGSVAISDFKSFGGPDVDGISTGMACDQQLVCQLRGEESLSVSLPADLSVETPPISLWPPLPSPQSSSSQMLSHFPGGTPSHFPFYEMNPMLGGPIFAFGPHEESAGTQSQRQKSSTTSSSGPLGTWQQCHSTVDSFYGPPAGYTGPFISQPGGIPGVQGPPHMVVYNHFAPVGQFGQVGLSFMGPTFIPSGKLPDWNHSSSSSAVGMGESDMNNANIAAVQRNPPNMAGAIQHPASSPPLMPMPSPLAMFDVSPFQSVPDIPVQACWSHVPASPLHSVPLSRPLQQAEGVPPSQFGHTHPIDQSLNVSRLSESRTSTPSISGPGFTVATELSAAQFPDELGLVDSSTSTTAGASTPIAVGQSSSNSAIADAGNTENLQSGGRNNNEGHTTSSFKSRSSQQKNLSVQQSHSASYNYQRGGSGASSRNNAGNEWSHSRMDFHGRNHTFGSDKGFPSKMKQIYVVKQTTSGLQLQDE